VPVTWILVVYRRRNFAAWARLFSILSVPLGHGAIRTLLLRSEDEREDQRDQDDARHDAKGDL
jgi:hypothetical protein